MTKSKIEISFLEYNFPRIEHGRSSTVFPGFGQLSAEVFHGRRIFYCDGLSYRLLPDPFLSLQTFESSDNQDYSAGNINGFSPLSFAEVPFFTGQRLPPPRELHSLRILQIVARNRWQAVSFWQCFIAINFFFHPLKLLCMTNEFLLTF